MLLEEKCFLNKKDYVVRVVLILLADDCLSAYMGMRIMATENKNLFIWKVRYKACAENLLLPSLLPIVPGRECGVRVTTAKNRLSLLLRRQRDTQQQHLFNLYISSKKSYQHIGSSYQAVIFISLILNLVTRSITNNSKRKPARKSLCKPRPYCLDRLKKDTKNERETTSYIIFKPFITQQHVASHSSSLRPLESF